MNYDIKYFLLGCLLIGQIAAIPYTQDFLNCRFLTMSAKGQVDSRLVALSGGFSKWILNNTLDGYFVLVNQASGLYLTGDPTADLTVFGSNSSDEYDYNGPIIENQKWIIQNDNRVDEGAFLIHKASGLYLDYTANNLKVFLAKQTFKLTQTWSVNPNDQNQNPLPITTTTTRQTTSTTTRQTTSTTTRQIVSIMNQKSQTTTKTRN